MWHRLSVDHQYGFKLFAGQQRLSILTDNRAVHVFHGCGFVFIENAQREYDSKFQNLQSKKEFKELINSPLFKKQYGAHRLEQKENFKVRTILKKFAGDERFAIDTGDDIAPQEFAFRRGTGAG